MIQNILKRAAIDCLALSVTTTSTMMATSQSDTGSPFAAVNQICHMIDGDDRSYSEGYCPRETPLGIALNGSAMFAWAVIYEGLFGKVRFPNSVATGLATAAGAYVVDYHLVPKRFTPGIEKKLSHRSMLACYLVLGFTLGLMSTVHRSKE